MKFKSISSPSKLDINIALVLLYFLYQIDSTILLRNDKRQLEDKSWNYAKGYLSNSGKVVQNIKKILPFLEDKRMPDPHYIEIKRYMESLNPTHVEVLHRKNGVTGIIYNYIMACFNLTKFLRTVHKVDEEPVVRRIPYNPPKPAPETRIMSQEDMNLIVSAKQSNFKVKLHSDLYNENLAIGMENLQKEAEIKSTMDNIQRMKNMKAQMVWKEKRAIKAKTGKHSKFFINYS